jgi:hypothetical protein
MLPDRFGGDVQGRCIEVREICGEARRDSALILLTFFNVSGTFFISLVGSKSVGAQSLRRQIGREPRSQGAMEL